MIQVEVLVEEASAEEALRYLLPKLLHGRARPKVINFGSKYKLLKVLKDRLQAYRVRIGKGEDLRIMVLVDRDDDDCAQLKAKLERIAAAAGLPTKSRLAFCCGYRSDPGLNGCFEGQLLIVS